MKDNPNTGPKPPEAAIRKNKRRLQNSSDRSLRWAGGLFVLLLLVFLITWILD